jgi:hypothetical protein
MTFRIDPRIPSLNLISPSALRLTARASPSSSSSSHRPRGYLFANSSNVSSNASVVLASRSTLVNLARPALARPIPIASTNHTHSSFPSLRSSARHDVAPATYIGSDGSTNAPLARAPSPNNHRRATPRSGTSTDSARRVHTVDDADAGTRASSSSPSSSSAPSPSRAVPRRPRRRLATPSNNELASRALAAYAPHAAHASAHASAATRHADALARRARAVAIARRVVASRRRVVASSRRRARATDGATFGYVLARARPPGKGAAYAALALLACANVAYVASSRRARAPDAATARRRRLEIRARRATRDA